MAELLGWLGNVFFILGAVAFSARKPIWGCVHNILGNLFYVAASLITPLYSLVILSIVLALINIWGIWNWSRKHENANKLA